MPRINGGGPASAPTPRRYKLASGLAVIAIGVSTAPTRPHLEQFQQLVAAHRVHWFVGDAGRGLLGDTSSGGSDQSRQITEWVTATFTPTSVDGTTLYDLSAAR